MPQRIIVESMHLATQMRWTNRYWTTALVSDAGTTLDGLVAAHKLALRNTCMITKIRIDDAVEDTNNYDTVSINQLGSVDGTGEMVPLWNTLRVDFDVSGGGSPSRKYLRGYLLEGDSTFLTLGAGPLAAANAYGNAVVALGTICDPQGNLFVDAVPWLAPQMRQQKRASKKQPTP